MLTNMDTDGEIGVSRNTNMTMNMNWVTYENAGAGAAPQRIRMAGR